MLFKKYHIPLIRAGEKTVTRRVWKPNHHRPLPGSVHMAKTNRFMTKEECDCFIEIDEDYAREDDQERLGDMTDADAQKEGDYETVEEFRESWIDINGEWNPDEIVDVVPFSYYGRQVA